MLSKLRSNGYFETAIFRANLSAPVWACAEITQLRNVEEIFQPKKTVDRLFASSRRIGEAASVSAMVMLEPDGEAAQSLQRQFEALKEKLDGIRELDGGRHFRNAEAYLLRHQVAQLKAGQPCSFDVTIDISQHITPPQSHIADEMAQLCKTGDQVEVLVDSPQPSPSSSAHRRNPRESQRDSSGRWVIGTVLARTHWAAAGSDIVAISLPRELTPSRVESASRTAMQQMEQMRLGRSRRKGAQIQATDPSTGSWVVLVDLGVSDFATRSRVAQRLAINAPSALVDMMISVERSDLSTQQNHDRHAPSRHATPYGLGEHGARTPSRAKVLAYLPQLNQHLLQRDGTSSVELADLTTLRFTTVACEQRVEQRSVLASLGTHTR